MASYTLDGVTYWRNGNNYGMGNAEYPDYTGQPGVPIEAEKARNLAIAGYNRAKAAYEEQHEKKRLSYGVNINDYYGINGLDKEKYRKAQIDWMRGNYAFEGWNEQQMNDFLDQLESGDYTDKQKQAMQIWNSVGIGMYNANQQKKADREDILAEIEAYKAGFSNEAIDVALANERQAWDTKIQGILQQAQQQAAAQGRVMDNTTYAMLRGRLEAQAANAIQQVQMQYEQKRQEYMLQAMQMKNDVYKNTTNTVMSYDDAIKIIDAMNAKKS